MLQDRHWFAAIHLSLWHTQLEKGHIFITMIIYKCITTVASCAVWSGPSRSTSRQILPDPRYLHRRELRVHSVSKIIQIFWKVKTLWLLFSSLMQVPPPGRITIYKSLDKKADISIKALFTLLLLITRSPSKPKKSGQKYISPDKTVLMVILAARESRKGVESVFVPLTKLSFKN